MKEKFNIYNISLDLLSNIEKVDEIMEEVLVLFLSRPILHESSISDIDDKITLKVRTVREVLRSLQTIHTPSTDVTLDSELEHNYLIRLDSSLNNYKSSLELMSGTEIKFNEYFEVFKSNITTSEDRLDLIKGLNSLIVHILKDYSVLDTTRKSQFENFISNEENIRFLETLNSDIDSKVAQTVKSNLDALRVNLKHNS